MAKVCVVGAGGSISIAGRYPLDLFDYGDHGRLLPIQELLDMFPDVSEAADVVPVQHRAMLSTAMTPVDWLELHRCITDTVDRHRPDGVVVTHGTSTLEETAYFLHLSLSVPVPVVLVGSQRPPTGLSTDAAINLLDAVRVAASPAAAGLGVLVVVNNIVHGARDVAKASTYALDTFVSRGGGPLGSLDPDGRVTIDHRSTRRGAPDAPFAVTTSTVLPRVDIAYSYAGADRAAIDAFVAAGAKGIVCAGVPAGRMMPAEEEALKQASAAGVAIAISSRSGGGRVMQRPRLTDAGFVAAADLNPQKARVLLMLALTTGADDAGLRTLFDEC